MGSYRNDDLMEGGRKWRLISGLMEIGVLAS